MSKALILGDPKSGKTSLLLSLASPEGKERECSLAFSEHSSLDILTWLPAVTCMYLTAKIILVGNKADKPRQVLSRSVQVLSDKHNLINIEVSAYDKSSLWPLKDLLQRESRVPFFNTMEPVHSKNLHKKTRHFKLDISQYRQKIVDLQVTFGQQQVVIGVRNGDNCYDIAAKVCKGRKHTPQDLNKLSKAIFQELQNFNDRCAKPNTCKMKKPENAGTVNVDLLDREFSFQVHTDQNSDTLAREICEQQDCKSVTHLKQAIDSVVNRDNVIFILNFQLSSQDTAEILVREGDDYVALAHSFTKKYGLPKEYVGKIYKLISDAHKKYYKSIHNKIN